MPPPADETAAAGKLPAEDVGSDEDYDDDEEEEEAEDNELDAEARMRGRGGLGGTFTSKHCFTSPPLFASQSH